jgi:hypothetical protein
MQLLKPILLSVFLVLSLIQAKPEQQKKAKAAPTTASQVPQTPAAVPNPQHVVVESIPNQHIAVDTLPTVHEEKPAKDGWDIALVIVGILTFFVVGYQAIETKAAAEATRVSAEATEKATKATERAAEATEKATAATQRAAQASEDSVKEVKAQALIMERQTTALEASVAIAKQNVDLVVSRERAKLRVNLDDFAPPQATPLMPKVSFPIKFLSVTLRIRFYGLSNAEIQSSGFESYLSDSVVPTPRTYMLPMQLPDVVTPLTPISPQSTYVSPYEISEADFKGLEELTGFLHVRGFIKYKDVFGIARETTFQQYWRITNSLTMIGPRLAYWSKTGSDEDNRET